MRTLRASEETKALKISIVGAGFMAVLGIVFYWLTRSEAILLDGVFSSIGFLMAMLTLKVAQIVALPDDDHFNYGYAHFAPLINLLKGLLMLVLIIVAAASSIDALFSGGRPLALGIAVVYGAFGSIGCAGFATKMYLASKETGSDLVAVDAKSWMIDTLLTFAVLIAFVFGWFIQDGPLAGWLDYIDPALVLILVILSAPIPIKIFMSNLRDMLGHAPEEWIQEAVERSYLKAVHDIAVKDYRIRLLRLGNTLNVLIHVQPAAEFRVDGLAGLDKVRDKIEAELDKLDAVIVLDVLFVNDMRFAK